MLENLYLKQIFKEKYGLCTQSFTEISQHFSSAYLFL